MKTRLLLLLSGLLLCLFVYPSAFLYPKDTLPDSNDTRLIAYIIGQVQENILTFKPLPADRHGLFYGRFFAPEQNTLAYSDLFLTTSLITLPAQIFTSHPIFIFNLAFILNFVLTCFFAFTFFEYLLQNKYTSTLSTLLFVLSGYHLHYYAHLQIFSLWLSFAALLNLLKYLESKKNSYLNFFLLFFTLQLAESIFTTYLLFFASIFLSFMRQVVGEILGSPCKSIKSVLYLYRFRIKSGMTKLVTWQTASLVIFPITWFLLLLPYAKLHFTFPEATRSIRDAAHFSLDLNEIFTLYHSWTIISIFLFSFIINKKTKILNGAETLAKTARNMYMRGLPETVTREYGFWRVSNHMFLFAVIMSLGPVLKIFGQTIKIFGWPIPLPYSLFYYLFPGFTGFRTPSRFIVLALLATTIIIGFNLNTLFKNLKSKTKIALIFLIFCFLVLEAQLPLAGYPVNINLHPVYQEVKVLPPSAIILELPPKLWNMPDHEIESIRSLYSLSHKHSRFGGYSGFATNNWIKIVEEINTYGLTPEITKKLKTLGITHTIKDNSLYHL